MSGPVAPCPLCGGRAFSRSDGNGHFVECIDCLCRTGWTYLDTLAIAAWNKRAPAERPAPDAGEWNAAIEAAVRWLSLHPVDGVAVTHDGQLAAIRALTRPAPAATEDADGSR